MGECEDGPRRRDIMTITHKLNLLKVDLGITSTAYDERLTQYIKSATAEIEREGVVLTHDDASTGEVETIDDANLIIMYAAWMWRKRDTGEGMPRMIRWQLNNRLFDLVD